MVTRMQGLVVFFFFCLQPHCLRPGPSLGAAGRNVPLRCIDWPFLLVVNILEGATLQPSFQGDVHWPESLGWNIPDCRGGRREGLCDCSQ